MEKPLFIPLNTRWFNEFARGQTDIEYRRYGPRWNHETCRIGRPVTLSHGYGKFDRLAGVILGTEIASHFADPAIEEIWGADHGLIIAIRIRVDTIKRLEASNGGIGNGILKQINIDK